MSSALTNQYTVNAHNAIVHEYPHGNIRFCVFQTEEFSLFDAVAQTREQRSPCANLVIENSDPSSPVKAVWVKGYLDPRAGVELEIYSLGVSDEQLDAFYRKKNRPCSIDFFSSLSSDTRHRIKSQWGFDPSFANMNMQVANCVCTLMPQVNRNDITGRIVVRESGVDDMIAARGARILNIRLDAPAPPQSRVMQALNQVKQEQLFSNNLKVNQDIVSLITDVLTQQLNGQRPLPFIRRQDEPHHDI